MEVGNSNAIKTWGATENADATKLVSSFNKFIIEQIPIYDYTTKEKLYNTLQLKDFLTAFTKLKEIGMSISSTKLDFSTWCKQLTSDTSFSDGYLSKIFKALFNSQNNVQLLKKLQEMGLNKNDLNTLYSVYRTAFKSTTTNGEKSWYQIEQNFALNTGLRSRYNLVENLYNLICSNEALNYLQTIYNYDTKEYETKIKERFSVDKFKFNLKTYANRNNYKREDKAKLIKDYSFTESADKLHYSFSVGGVTYNVHITSNDVNLLSKKHPSSKYEITATYIEDGQTITQDISKVFFGDHAIQQVELKEANKRKAIIEDTGSPFMQLLSFVNNMLQSNFGNTPESLSELYFAMQHQSSFLRDLVLSATRGLQVCNIYNKLEKAISENEENKNKYSKCHIDTYLKDIKEYPGIISSEDTAEYYEKNSLGQYLSTIHPNETWVDTLAKANAIVNNNTSQSVTSDLEGNHVPNVSPAYLSASNSIKQQMEMSSMNGKASGYLLFSENNNALEIATVNLDIQSSLFKPKSQKNFTCSELFQDAILNKFIYPLVNGGKIYIQSTTQSDKTKFIANRVNLKNIKVDQKTLFEYCKSPQELRSKICEMLRNTIGKAYQQVQSEVLLDYQKIFPQIKTITDLNNLLKTYTEKSLLAEVTKYNETSNNPITLYKDLHYRNVNGGLAINELLDEFANNLYTKNNDRLERRLQLEEVRFLNNLTKNMFSIELTDQLRTAMRKLNININEWTKTITDKSEDEQNPKSTTYLILAKQNNKNILMGKVDETIPVTLNPLLETYFLTDNLIGNNIRFGTTGTEINHKIKALSKINLRKELNKQTNSPEFANAVFGPDTNITFHDLKNAIEINKNIPEVYTLLSDLYNRLIYKLENLGQNAQFKRNVIMSATMTKMIPSLNGISKDMNIAVIYDMPATVFNFSGEQTEIDAHDGSALISPLWSILENKSLGSNEVGSVKKTYSSFL